MVKHFTATAKGAEALAYGPQQEYIDKYKIYILVQVIKIHGNGLSPGETKP